MGPIVMGQLMRLFQPVPSKHLSRKWMGVKQVVKKVRTSVGLKMVL